MPDEDEIKPIRVKSEDIKLIRRLVIAVGIIAVTLGVTFSSIMISNLAEDVAERRVEELTEVREHRVVSRCAFARIIRIEAMKTRAKGNLRLNRRIRSLIPTTEGLDCERALDTPIVNGAGFETQEQSPRAQAVVPPPVVVVSSTPRPTTNPRPSPSPEPKPKPKPSPSPSVSPSPDPSPSPSPSPECEVADIELPICP